MQSILDNYTVCGYLVFTDAKRTPNAPNGMRREHKEYIVVTTTEKKSFYAPDENGTMRKNTIEKEIPEIVEIPAKLSDANKSAELLGKRYRMFTDNVNLDGGLQIIFTGENDLED